MWVTAVYLLPHALKENLVQITGEVDSWNWLPCAWWLNCWFPKELLDFGKGLSRAEVYGRSVSFHTLTTGFDSLWGQKGFAPIKGCLAPDSAGGRWGLPCMGGAQAAAGFNTTGVPVIRWMKARLCRERHRRLPQPLRPGCFVVVGTKFTPTYPNCVLVYNNSGVKN